jgi:hypothetical protein
MDAVLVEPVAGDDVDDLGHPHDGDHHQDELQRVDAVGTKACGHRRSRYRAAAPRHPACC